jgi:hypothetical protein
MTSEISLRAWAAVMFVIPTLMARDAAGVMWILTACVVVSGVLGLVITRHPLLRPQLQPSLGTDRRPITAADSPAPSS